MKLDLKGQPRSETLVGTARKIPLSSHDRGNCVDVGPYHVRNITAENLRYWEEASGATEVEVEEVADNVVEVVDMRVPDHLLRARACKKCERQAMLRKKRG